MAKKDSKRGKGKKGAANAPSEPRPAASTSSPDSGLPPLPPGQRHYDLPYSAPAPRLLNAELGLHNLMARAGHNAAYTIDVTLLDAPDHRLTRSGVLLAHRVLDGRGEWYLSAPDWQPLLPKDKIELMGHADLPEGFADLIRPFRRRATLGPVAALNCDRREFALRDDHGTTVALLRDDKVTVRRGGLTTARYRQVMITPIGPGLSDEQRAWLDRGLIEAGATRLPRFPQLVTRLGAPATGPTDIPEARPFDAAASFRTFVSSLLGLRLRKIVEADLAIRNGNRAAVTTLADQAARLRQELKGLSFLLDPDWVEDLYDELGWIRVDPTDLGTVNTDQFLTRMRSERYLTLLERLVTARRTPKLADGRSAAAGEVLDGLVTTMIGKVKTALDRVETDAPAEVWEEAHRALGQLEWIADLTAHVRPDETAQRSDLLARASEQLDEIAAEFRSGEEALAMAQAMSPADAFAAGRAYEARLRDQRRVRRDFAKAWPKLRKKLG